MATDTHLLIFQHKEDLLQLTAIHCKLLQLIIKKKVEYYWLTVCHRRMVQQYSHN